MKTTHKFLLALTIAGLAGSAAALAQEGSGGMGMERHGGPAYAGRLFNRLDANHDGVVTREEVTNAPMKRFDRLDANHDGKATAEEIDAAIMKRLQKRVVKMRYRLLGRLDANGDGVVSREEAQAKKMALFERADLNGDGKVDKAEAAALRHKAKGMKRRMKMRMMRRMMRGQGGMGRMPAQMGD